MSWNGTVRCGNCYESGHNRTGCPALKKAWEADPESYDGRQWARIIQTKAKPKTCSYCGEQGHTRAGCAELKTHKQLYQEDAIIFRKAIAKWMHENGLGIGALVRAKDIAYHNRDQKYMNPTDGDYVPPVGLVINTIPAADHYIAVSGSSEWMGGQGLLSMQLLGSDDMEHYRRNVGLALPCIPGIVPRMGKDWYNGLVDRVERCSNVDWEVVSSGYVHFDSTDWASTNVVRDVAKAHFAGPNEQTARDFRELTSEQRTQLRQYVNGEIELSEMKDAELPENDT
jgi:hypothetical protein